jgi:hypothetical protein
VGIFRKPADPIGEIDASLTQLRRKRAMLESKSAEAKADCEKAQAAWESALHSDDPKLLDRFGARLLQAKELANLLDSELDGHATQIAIAESELSFAQDRAAREARAALLENQAATIEPMFDQYAAAAGRFANELSKIEGLFDAEAASSIILQTPEIVLGAKQSILNQMQFLADELRRDPPPRAPEPLKLPTGTMPRGILPSRNDPHPLPIWAGDRAFP